jgi:hypothetical protein
VRGTLIGKWRAGNVCAATIIIDRSEFFVPAPPSALISTEQFNYPPVDRPLGVGAGVPRIIGRTKGGSLAGGWEEPDTDSTGDFGRHCGPHCGRRGRGDTEGVRANTK